MRNITDFYFSPCANLREFIEIIVNGIAQIALVVDSENKLLSVITDSGLIRDILLSVSFESISESVRNRDFYSFPISTMKELTLVI